MSWIKDFIHNCIVHPFMPKHLANRFHDWNGTWAFGLERYDELKLEKRK